MVGTEKLLIGSLIIMIIGVISLSIATSWLWLILFVLCVGIGYGMTFLASSVLLSNYFGRGPYLELFSVVNLLSTLACLAPLLLVLLKIIRTVSRRHFLLLWLPLLWC